MSGPEESNGRAEPRESGAGVLANLPRTRPQRSSARRVAARRASSGNASDAPAPAAPKTSKAKLSTTASGSLRRASAVKKAAKPTAAKVAVRKAPKVAAKSASATTAGSGSGPQAKKRARVSKPEAPPVPRQGFASEEARATGAVQPPGGTELASTAAEILGELAKAGLSTGERLLRDVFSRLPGA